jgi:hypothetical protein
MAALHEHHDDDRWSTERWTGEPDNAAAVALGACLALAALLLLVFAVGLLGPPAS